MAVEKINYEDTLRQGADKINAILEQSNASSIKVDGYEAALAQGVKDAKQIATDAGKDAVQVATQAGEQANTTANEAKGIAQNANTKSDQAVSTANQNKQEFDQLRNDFDDLVAEAGDSNPEIVQARTDTQGIKQTTLSNRLTSDFNSRMSKADGIEMISGQTIVAKMMDFQGKTAGNTATNPHAYYSDFTANTLKKPSATWNEVSQSDYNKLASRDDSGISTGSTAAGIIPQQMAILDAVATAKALSPQVFDGLTDEESVQFVKDNFVSFTVGVRVKAVSPNNKNAKVGLYMPATDSWSTVIQQDATEFTDFTTQINDSQYIDAKGKVHLIYYVDASNGVKPSSFEADYTGVKLELTIDAQVILEKSGFAKTDKTVSQNDLIKHTENNNNPHKVTATQVGLENVDNYKTANINQATVGSADNLFLTPLGFTNAYASKTRDYKKTTRYIAHRGANKWAPENSIQAFKMVTRQDAIETDIQVTSDGVWVCMHDATVDRMTNGTGTVAGKSYSEIKKLDIDVMGIGTYAGSNVNWYKGQNIKIPTFEEYLIICKAKGKIPVIEIKDAVYTTANYQNFVNILEKYSMVNSTIVISGSINILNTIRGFLPSIELHYVVSSISDQIIKDANSLGFPSGIDVEYSSSSISQINIDKIKQNGMKVNVWSVPANKFSDFENMGIDYITTDEISGDRKLIPLAPTLKNGWKDYYTGLPTNMTYPSFLEELGNDWYHIHLHITSGIRFTATEISTIPEDYVPVKSIWGEARIRTSSGVALGTCDLEGFSSGTPGLLKTGLGWDLATTGWVIADIYYSKA